MNNGEGIVVVYACEVTAAISQLNTGKFNCISHNHLFQFLVLNYLVAAFRKWHASML